MSDHNEKLSQLQKRLDKMVEYQGYFNREIGLLDEEINALKKNPAFTESKKVEFDSPGAEWKTLPL